MPFVFALGAGLGFAEETCEEVLALHPLPIQFDIERYKFYWSSGKCLIPFQVRECLACPGYSPRGSDSGLEKGLGAYRKGTPYW